MGSSWVFYHGAHFHSDSDGWCDLKLLRLELEDQLGSVFKFSLVHSRPFKQSVETRANFPLVITSRDVGYSSMGLKLLNNIGNSGHRNIRLFGDGLIM